MKDYSEAQKIFFYYDGLFFHMDREGDYQNFRKFGVPSEMLTQWRLEIFQKYASEIKKQTSHPDSLGTLVHCFDPESSTHLVEDLLKTIQSVFPNYCTFGKIRASESLIDLSKKRIGKELKQKSSTLSQTIIKSIPEGLEVCSHYWNMSSLRDVLSKDKLRKRINGILNSFPNCS
jgi:hypothetical protein